MNITELARQLKVTTEELFDILPQLGFDIGRRAIKVDNKIADRIAVAWKKFYKQELEMKRIAEIRGEASNPEKDDIVPEMIEVKIPSVIAVREFASLLDLPVNKVLTELMKNGVLTSMNERIDFDTAHIVGEELGYKVIEDQDRVDSVDSVQDQKKLADILKERGDKILSRPPVVVVMGHVDHGKTKILDAIRKADVVSSESGGITQHIGAYQVHRDDKIITFIDTPGHEAFTAMRSRGARVADIAILVIAADDSIQPQTKEAIKIIKDAGLPFIVAINKIDKPEANIEKVKQDLSALNLLPEDWGGKVITVPVSAKEGTGIEDLLDTLLLVAEMEKENIVADENRSAIGTIIESHIDKGEGNVATILIQAGTLKVGDILGMSGGFLGRVRMLKDYKNQQIQSAAPGMPVKILGLKMAPEVGSILEVSDNPNGLDKNIKQQKLRQQKDFSVQTKIKENEGIKYINLIIKADVLGSIEAIIESLAKKETKEVKIRIISKGLGSITEADVQKAETAKAKILGFHIKPTVAVADLAREIGVVIKCYEVIYHLIEDIETEMAGLKEEKSTKKLVGKLEIIKVFRQEAKTMIVGGRVIDGGLCVCDTVIITRGGKAITSGKVTRLECSKSLVESVSSGQECGVTFSGKPLAEAGDILEFYQKQ
ncbi:MAG TPA: translation initiation factor IF-2 [Patescibacteria group bacterium]|nr:translation initiation factor IF-2 [Patescibacteria group bacterium]